MNRKIKIFAIDNRYAFSIDNFSSMYHFQFTNHVKPSYQFPWQAYYAARNIVKKYAYHIEASEKKYAIEDFVRPIIDDVSAETKLIDYYWDVLDDLEESARGMFENDEDQKKINYTEAKAVVSEILFIKKNIDENSRLKEEEKQKSKKEFNEIISKIKKIVHRYYEEELQKDIKKKKEEAESAPEIPEMTEDPSLLDSGEETDGMNLEMPMAQVLRKIIRLAKVDPSLKESMMNEYGVRACQAIYSKHKDIIYKIKDNMIYICDLKGNKLLCLEVGKDLFVVDIFPVGKIKEICPYHSLEFYQRYWKPIVEEIGHCCIEDKAILFFDKFKLPDIPSSFPRSQTVQAIDKNSKEIVTMEVSFKGDNPSWFIDKTKVCTAQKAKSSKYTEEEYLKGGKGAIVVCIDKTLPSYYGKTGQVIQVIPLCSHVEVDINFGRHVARMVEDQFEIIDEL